MVKKILKPTLAVLSGFFGLACLGVSSPAKETKATEEPWKTTLDMKVMLTKFAEAYSLDSTVGSIDGTDGAYSYGFRHGSIGNGQVDKFSSITYTSDTSWLYNTKNVDDINVFHESTGVQMFSRNNDGLICFFTAKEDMFFTAEATNVSGWLADMYISYFTKAEEATSYTPVKSTRCVSGNYSANIALQKTLVPQGTTIYWELRTPASVSGYRNMQWIFPNFELKKYVELPAEEFNSNTIISSIASDGEVTTPNEFAKYTVRNDSVVNASYSTATKGNLGSAGGDYHLTTSGLTLKNSNAATFEVNMIESCTVSLKFDETTSTSVDGLTISGYKKDKAGKTKQIFTSDCSASINRSMIEGNVYVEGGETLYIEYKVASGKTVNTNLLPQLRFDQASDIPVDFPKYNPHDLTSLTSINSNKMLTESARLLCEPFQLADVKASLVTGTVGNERPFTYITYDDGIVLGEEPTAETGIMFEGDNKFDATSGAGIMAGKVCYSRSNQVIFKFEATKNTHLVATNKTAVTSGWRNGASNYVWGSQKIDGKTVKVGEINVQPSTEKETVANIPVDGAKVEYNLKAGDIAYYYFGTTEANNANLNIVIDFDFDSSKYDAEARNAAIFDFNSYTGHYPDLVTQVVANGYQTIETGLLDITLGHGALDEIEQFNNHTGNGTGGADDALYNGGAGENKAGMQRWQMRCGKNDDAIVAIKAYRDTHLTITRVNSTEKELSDWATHTILKSYALDSDGFLMLLDTKPVYKEGHASKTDTYYNYDVHVKEGQTFIIDYTSMGANYGVIQYNFDLVAKTSEYDETKAFDFTASKALQVYKDGKIAIIDEMVNSRVEDDYSINNWAYILEAADKFKEKIVEMTTTEEVDEAFLEAKNRIESILSIAQEAQALVDAKAAAIAEGEEYFNARKPYMSSGNLSQANAKFTKFVSDVNGETSQKKVSLALTRFKADIDNLCDIDESSGSKEESKGGCGGSIVAASALVSTITLLGASLVLSKKNKEK